MYGRLSDTSWQEQTSSRNWQSTVALGEELAEQDRRRAVAQQRTDFVAEAAEVQQLVAAASEEVHTDWVCFVEAVGLEHKD